MAATAKFPTAALALTDVFGELPNMPPLTLNGAINASVTSIVVNEAIPATWPQASWITIDTEILRVTSYNAGTKTFTVAARDASAGNAQSTTAATHASGAYLFVALTAQQWNQAVAEIIAIETALGTAFTKYGDPTAYSTPLALSITTDYAKVAGTGAASLTGGLGPALYLTTGANANSVLRHISGLDRGGSFSRVKFYRSVVNIVTSVAATEEVFFGVAAITGATAINFATEKHIGFKYDPSGSANWIATVSNGAAESTLDTGVAITINVDAALAFQYDGTTATFWVNGVNKGTIATANCPTGAGTNGLSMTHYIDNKAVANARDCLIFNALAVVSAT